MSDNQFDVSIESSAWRFKEHLETLKNNNRILFSGKFGTGKSFFLRKYFDRHSDKYNLFWISPVNYVVGANQDIFEWIKIDIAIELNRKYLIDDTDPIPQSLIRDTFIYNNAATVISKLMKAALKIKIQLSGKEKILNPVFQFWDDIPKIFEEYQHFKKDVKENIMSSYSKLEDYIKTATSIKGSIFEEDIITAIIRNAILLVKEDTNKECILIIDDLDRLDPEHIFRILNILSAHNDPIGEYNELYGSNKFSFDRIILVGDVENIRHIFQHRYGINADFIGYIEKYFSYEPFRYSINDMISTFCHHQDIIKGIDEDNRKVMGAILSTLVSEEMVNIRQLKKLLGISLKKQLPVLYSDDIGRISNQNDFLPFYIEAPRIEIHCSDLYFFRVIYILSLVLGNIDFLKKAIEQLAKENVSIPQTFYKSYLNATVIPYHIARNKGNLNDMAKYFNTTNDTYPTVKFKNGNCDIPLIWRHLDNYKGGHYFVLADTISNRNTRIEFTEFKQWREFATIFNTIIDFTNVREMFGNV